LRQNHLSADQLGNTFARAQMLWRRPPAQIEVKMRLLTPKRSLILFSIIAVYLFYSLAFGSTGAAETGNDSGHGGLVLEVLLGLIVILLGAKLGGDLFERFGQPAVLGEHSAF
jgi:hypothetical protein